MTEEPKVRTFAQDGQTEVPKRTDDGFIEQIGSRAYDGSVKSHS